ncbi:hypothetical protein I3760_03G200500 [Carya illinoinensis]|nr:hypothetical protein I3760_03G200500 [Carya illinoinensis]
MLNLVGLKRCGKSFRLRWLNYLRPDIKRGNISVEEEELIINLSECISSCVTGQWSLIAGRIPGRTDNEIKNYWNTHLSRRIMQYGYKILQDSYKQDGELITDDDEGSNWSEFTQGTGQETHDHSAIRTKAMRCSNAFIPKQLDIAMEKNANSHQDRELNECENMVDGEMDHAKNNIMSSCEDFLISGHDQAMHENWRPQTEPNSQPNDALDLKTLTSLLNLEDDSIIS